MRAGENTVETMSLKNFLVALAITALFLGILVVAGTAQNDGCLPWKEPVRVGGGGTFSETPGQRLCK